MERNYEFTIGQHVKFTDDEGNVHIATVEDKTSNTVMLQGLPDGDLLQIEIDRGSYDWGNIKLTKKPKTAMPKQTNIDQEYVLEYRKQLGAKLKETRKAANLTLQQVGEAIGTTAGTISKIELGQYSTEIDLYIKIAITLNLKISLS
jgi:DNA-binding XRE family transcriptional regulator